MSKNALQAQLMKAGLVDSKKAKKINKQTAHAKRTGQDPDAEIKKAVEAERAEKLAKDQALNQQKQHALEQKTLKANIFQMITQHQIADTAGEAEYKFADRMDSGKIKKILVTDKLFEQIVAGQVAIARTSETADTNYALLPRPLADRITQKAEELDDEVSFIVVSNDKADDAVDEDDPYADYVIPDDLMW